MNFTPLSDRIWNVIVFLAFLVLIFFANYAMLKHVVGVPEDFADTGAYIVTIVLGLQLDADF